MNRRGRVMNRRFVFRTAGAAAMVGLGGFGAWVLSLPSAVATICQVAEVDDERSSPARRR
jgi:hypothetical protein